MDHINGFIRELKIKYNFILKNLNFKIKKINHDYSLVIFNKHNCYI
jgi:hypothetical protein